MQTSGPLLGGFCRVQFAQLCDNASVSSSVLKMLSMREPLCFVLQALGFWACRLGFHLQISHVAGVRNTLSNALSRDSIPADFVECNRLRVCVKDLLAEPWVATAVA